MTLKSRRPLPCLNIQGERHMYQFVNALEGVVRRADGFGAGNEKDCMVPTFALTPLKIA